ncbi:type I addiction module toxin, SymE family|uniref:Toxic protein SymE n=1 Tax=Dendrosporobacter quercicolus TaxID=146817 RepID=A0A1G9X7B5_9FIRM|nr:SymE family type I addiction module toxin [Dendrosporobacter quercicolus]NSL49933.1 type I addiction module toxin, SymE family [Dendrosporobacter quercicolus DSM 1736]SDM92376.1 toxic protein SymE [Dendrosporobacter quercicolus]
MTIMGKSTRILTIYYTYQNGATRPLIRLQGKWLQELGFLPGAKIEVKENEGSLFIKTCPLPSPCPPGNGRR